MATPHAKRAKHWYQNRHIVHKVILWFLALIVLWIGTMYGLAQWYIYKHHREPLNIGVTFIPQYARYFDLEPKETMQAMIDDLGMRRFRLVSYWHEIEPSPGKYDFSQLDWQFDKVEQAGGNISLAIGLRQPRWPECHWPTWAQKQPKKVWSKKLKVFMGKVIDRYKDRKVLTSYQLENEFFMKVFGICPDHTRARLVDEYNFVKQKDSSRPVIVSRSNNWVGIPLYAPKPDQFGVSVYKRVWDKNITKRYFEYPFPPWFYSHLAGLGEIMSGKDMIIHELQAEPWMPEGFDIRTASIEEQNKSMDAERLKDRIQYGVDTGIRTIDLWGAEWWYFRKVKLGDPSVWDAARQKITELSNSETQCNDVYRTTPNGRSQNPC